MVSPVHDAALVVPFVLAAEFDEVPFPQRLDARGKVDIVRDQQRLPGVELEDEALVAVTEAVVAENAGHAAAAADGDAARAARVRLGNRIVARGRAFGCRRGRHPVGRWIACIGPLAVEIEEDCEDGGDEEDLLHAGPPGFAAARRGIGCQ